MSPRNSWVSVISSLPSRSLHRSNQRESRASTVWAALQAADCCTAASTNCRCRARVARKVWLCCTSPRNVPTSTTEAAPATRTTARLRAISSSIAADPPARLSRPIIAVSIISPEARSTTMDTIPVWGKWMVLIVSPASNNTVSCGSSITRRCGASAAKSSGGREARSKFEEWDLGMLLCSFRPACGICCFAPNICSSPPTADDLHIVLQAQLQGPAGA